MGSQVVFLIAALIVVIVLMIVGVVWCLHVIKDSKQEEKEKLLFEDTSDYKERKIFKERTFKSMITPDGVDPNPLSYMVVNDNGRDAYIRNFYIHTMPKRVQFATSFAPLFDYNDCVASVFVFPIDEGKSIRQLDNRIVKIESEVIQAKKEGDRNRARKMMSKFHEAEEWARSVENGENSLYEVGFLFTLYAESLEELNLRTQQFVTVGRNKGIELVSTYGVHPEAFLSNAPFNQIYSLNMDSFGLIKSIGIKMNIMDKYSLATVFHHTNSSFTHKNGIPAGRNLNTWEPLLYDPYDKSHNGFGVVICGMTGTGKSAMIKMYTSRLYHQGYKFVCIDSDRKGGRGEFSNIADKLTGVSFQIKNGSEHRFNPFDIEKQVEWDEPTGTEYPNLRLTDKISNLSHIIMTMICGDDEHMDFELSKSISSIVRKSINELYNERGIIDGKPDSIYETGKVLVNGVLEDGMVKKKMPILSDFFVKVVRMRLYDKESSHDKAYTVILDAMGEWVTHVIYNKVTGKVYSQEEYMKLVSEKSQEVNDIEDVRGTKAYFDGETTINFNIDVPFTNIDISDLPKADIPIAQEFACNFVDEHFMKKNSENPKKASKMVVICDEAHRMFKYEGARSYLEDWYRTARKRHISVWTCTQALKDFDGYKETEAILTNATSKFLFKQNPQHEDYIRSATELTDSQIRKLFQIGGDPDDDNDEHKGECCLIDNNKCVFLKVDYLSSERYIVETNVENLKKMYA